MDCQVAVVGAGPVGLLLAGELRLHGCSVVVLETLAEPTGQSRASTLHARTMEILDERGLLGRLGPVAVAAAGHFGGLPLDLGRVDSPFAGQWKVPQPVLERLLGGWAAELGADVRRGHRVRDVHQDRAGVSLRIEGPDGPLALRCGYLVGCDGQDSTVRRLAGFVLTGRPGARELLRADVLGISVPDRRFQRLARGFAVASTRDGVTRVMVHQRDRPAPPRPGLPSGPGIDRGAGPTFAELVDRWRDVTGEDIGGGRPTWVDAFSDTCRQVSGYRRGRVLLAGDAAHQQLPTGGQAINLGLHDAMNLGWKLAAQVIGRVIGRSAGRSRPDQVPDLLDSYHDERHPVTRRALTAIEAQALLLLGGPEVEPCRDVLAELIEGTGHGDHPAGDHLAATIAGLDVRYPVGGGTHPLLGARLGRHEVRTPDGVATTTTNLLRPGRGLLLDLTDPSGVGGPAADLAGAAGCWSADPPIVAGASDSPGLRGVRAVLVRPDGHVARLLDRTEHRPTEHRPTEHRPTEHRPTERAPTHRPPHDPQERSNAARPPHR
jgi:2-polyprenyl-6-methoxyphenol hydroxylase-like FAD-dependent oxidoreductase